MKLRHECKHEINLSDMLVIRQRLSAVIKRDENGAEGKYFVRSLYFDDFTNKALREKIDGINIREKFRIRFYNNDTSFIRLEKKSKRNGLCVKESATLTKSEAQSLTEGEYDWLINSDLPLLWELYSKMKTGLKPKTIADYTREAFVYPYGNVRVTIDRNIRTGMNCTEIFDENCPTVSAGNSPIILEVKWDEFLPSVIRDLVQMEGRRTSSFSKYAACRIYG
ncbi:MAG: polyphosphate polymerase domain-containing protein [Ruminiclostridium sp.]|nr:polyphosphate polymerase domain-containing protein [Ruminiclostridium sp.]